jgi:hypothetical protein
VPGVDVWGWSAKDGPAGRGLVPDRDARAYDGDRPVVAHPPCGPWGKFSWRYRGGEGARDCAPRAIEQVRAHGGVVEHPVGSSLWRAMDLPRPGAGADRHGGTTIEVQQVDWGHPAAKPTLLYVVGLDLDGLPPMPPTGTPTRLITTRAGSHLRELTKSHRHLTPWRFALWLVDVASRCEP